MPTKSPKRLYRSESNRVVAGVAAGIAEYFNIDPTLTRLFFVLITLTGGAGIPVYLICWTFIPSKSDLKHDSSATIKKNSEEIKHEAQRFGQHFRDQSGISVNPAGIVLIILGIYFLLHNFGLVAWLDFGKVWPILLILAGVFTFARK